MVGLSSWTIGQKIQLTSENPRTTKQKTESGIITPKVTSSQAYIERGPISITSDFQLNNSGFPGNGTIDDPIRIEGYNITSSSGTLISISDTTYYFRIANCLINGMSTAGDGISFSNVIHGSIDNNIIISGSVDISVKSFGGGLHRKLNANIGMKKYIINNDLGFAVIFIIALPFFDFFRNLLYV